jgi:hypothetical protein
MWKNTVEPERLQTTTERMRIARWIPKATKTHSEYVIIITFPLQQWLYERASMVRYTYTVCLAGLCHQGVHEIRRRSSTHSTLRHKTERSDLYSAQCTTEVKEPCV